MADAEPLVSVIVPAYNHQAFVEQAIQSVLDQKYQRVELIVVDDASSDETPNLVRSLAEHHGFTFLQNTENLGLNATLERGLRICRGKYVSFLASDDLMLPTKIERQVSYLEATGKDAVYANGRYLLAGGSEAPIDLTAIGRHFAAGTILRHIYTQDTEGPLLQSALIRREVLLELWPVRSEFKSDDWVTLIKLLENYEVGFVDEPLFLYRQHASNTYRDYWATLPMRVDVIARAVPQELRVQAIAHLLASIGGYLRRDGKAADGLRLQIASAILHPSPRRAGRHALNRLRAAMRKARKAMRSRPLSG